MGTGSGFSDNTCSKLVLVAQYGRINKFDGSNSSFFGVWRVRPLALDEMRLNVEGDGPVDAAQSWLLGIGYLTATRNNGAAGG